jgi:hypothetical protein
MSIYTDTRDEQDADYQRTLFIDSLVDQRAEVTIVLTNGDSRTGIVKPHPTDPGDYVIRSDEWDFLASVSTRAAFVFAVEDVRTVVFE